jgi:hypothetical protein
MRPFPDTFFKPSNALSPTLAYGLAIVLFCLPAIWNGFPLIHDDVGGYLERWPAQGLEKGRSVPYGLLLWVTRSTWWVPAIVVQSLVTVWTIDRALKVVGRRRSQRTVVYVVAGIAVTSGAAIFVSKVMPDAWVAPAVLSLHLLAWHTDCLSPVERATMAAIIIFAGASHMATLALLLALSVLHAVGWLFTKRARIAPAGILFGAGAAWLGLAALLAIDLLVAGRIVVTPGGEVFLFGRLVESGLVGKTLAKECPRLDWQLCSFQKDLPSTADYFLWGADSPLYNIGGWDDDRVKEEFRSITTYSIQAYPLEHLLSAIAVTIQQIAAVDIAVLTMKNSSSRTLDAVNECAPWLVHALNDSRQQRGEFDLTLISTWVVVPVSIAGLYALPLVAVLLWRRGHYREAILPAMCFFALVVNASICGIFSGPYPRYQARIAWLAPFASILALTAAQARPVNGT